MNFDLDIITANSLVIVPIVIAVVQALKLMPWFKDHYAPLVSIAIGIVVGFLADHNDDLGGTILSGVIYGLIASGLYSGVKTTMVAQARMKAQKKQSQKKDNC